MWRLLFCLLASPALAESLVATRPIRAQQAIAAEDVTLVDADIDGALRHPAQAIGLEARVVIYPGRPVRAADIGPPAIVERNQIVPLAYRAGALAILTEGRALSRGGAGDMIKVMNLTSRTTVTGLIGSDGTVIVGPTS
ncbi:MAG: flagellar basal body P-ring formation chaperone FlgA [Paracoccaceae bacterium]